MNYAVARAIVCHKMRFILEMRNLIEILQTNVDSIEFLRIRQAADRTRARMPVRQLFI